MNVLEKILEEIDEQLRIIKNIPDREDGDFMDGEECYEDGRVQGRYEELVRCKEIIRSHMGEMENGGWIPVEERMPEEHNSMFAKFKSTQNWSNAMFEKMSDEVNVTIELEDGTRKTTTSYTLDGKWKVEKEQQVVKKKVIAWQPLPEPYKGGKE